MTWLWYVPNNSGAFSVESNEPKPNIHARPINAMFLYTASALQACLEGGRQSEAGKQVS